MLLKGQDPTGPSKAAQPQHSCCIPTGIQLHPKMKNTLKMYISVKFGENIRMLALGTDGIYRTINNIEYWKEI